MNRCTSLVCTITQYIRCRLWNEQGHISGESLLESLLYRDKGSVTGNTREIIFSAWLFDL